MLLIILLILLLVLLLFLIFLECLQVNNPLSRLFLRLSLTPTLLELVDDPSDPVDHLIEHVLLCSALSHLLQIQGSLSGILRGLPVSPLPPLLLVEGDRDLPGSVRWEVVAQDHAQDGDREDNDAQNNIYGAALLKDE